MTKDHYVSQVHLKNFYAPALNGRKMYGFGIASGKSFPCGAQDICFVPDGSTNAFLPEPRLVEEFLKPVEPRYNAACAALRYGTISSADISVVAAFVAYVMACSLAARRLGTERLNARLKLEMMMADEMGLLPQLPSDLPAALRGLTVAQLLDQGHLLYETDPKYAQAIGIAGIQRQLVFFGNCQWDILLNEHDDTPFFTSDHPVAVENTTDPMIVNRIVPLTPRLAVRIRPRRFIAGHEPRAGFEHFRYRRRAITRPEAMAVNRLIIRCAEDLVLSSLDSPWVAGFVGKNTRFRLEAETTDLTHDAGVTSVGRVVLRQRGLPTGS